MSRLLGAVLVVMSFAMSGFAQTTSAHEVKKSPVAEDEISSVVSKGMGQIPADVQARIDEAKNAMNAARKEIDALVNDGISNEDLETFVSMKKAEAESMVKLAIARMEHLSVEKKTQLEATCRDILTRIDAKKAELDSRKAEIERIGK